MVIEADVAYRALQSRDPRFDGIVFVGVRSTRIYCRPSCPARTPNRANVRFYPSAAAAQRAGHRACKRCRPDATPGSADWDARADLAGRAVRLIADGIIDRSGVPGLAAHLGYSERQLTRALVAEIGAPPLALARAQRAQTARILLETTDLSASDVAFAAGFSSIRQFNDTIRDVYAATPTALRARSHHDPGHQTGLIELRLAYRKPMDLSATIRFLSARAVGAVEHSDGPGSYTRTMRLPQGPALVSIRDGDGFVRCQLRLSDQRDLTAAVARLRRLLDLNADPTATDAVLSQLPAVRDLVGRRPGLRAPGSVDGFEMAARALVGQQISVTGARTILTRLTIDHGTIAFDDGDWRLFPSADAIAGLSPHDLPMPRTRGRTLIAVAAAMAEGTLSLDSGSDREATRAALLAVPGIGEWTADYLLMRAVGHPDIYLTADLGVRHALARLGQINAQAAAPWRSYLTHHLWAHLQDSQPENTDSVGAFS